jgi:hypothetical protein
MVEVGRKFLMKIKNFDQLLYLNEQGKSTIFSLYETRLKTIVEM